MQGRSFCKSIRKLICTSLLPFALDSCAVSTGDSRVGARGDPEIFRVGEPEVWLYQDREKMAQDLPILLTLVDATRVADKQVKLLGYYDKEKKRIYPIDDARILIHEFKHYLEPDWRHALGTSRLQGLPKDTEQKSAVPEAIAFEDEPFHSDLVFDLWREQEELEIIADESKIEKRHQPEETIKSAR